MGRTVINNLGTIDYPDGSGVTIEVPTTLNALPATTVQAKTAATTLVNPGVYTATGGSPLVLTMPLASAVPGGVFVLRAASAQAHALTGSQEANGTLVFTDGTSKGSKIAVANVIGSSVAVMSDGTNFIVIGNSGSVAFSSP